MNERNRLAWRCRRGMLELDLVLESFLAQGYDRLTMTEQADFTRLLELPDQELFEALLGIRQLKERDLAHVITRIRATTAF